MRNILLILLVFVGVNAYSQNKKVKDNFTVKIREEKGDLNKDGLEDKVLVLMDTVNTIQPLKLDIFFLQPNGEYRLAVSSTELIAPQYPNGKYGGDQIPDVFIEDGYFILYSEIKSFHNQYKFLFKNGKFQLIHISKVSWDGKNTTTETEFDLIKGIRTEITQSLGSEKILKKSEKTIAIKTLPTIETLKTLDHQWD